MGYEFKTNHGLRTALYSYFEGNGEQIYGNINTWDVSRIMQLKPKQELEEY